MKLRLGRGGKFGDGPLMLTTIVMGSCVSVQGHFVRSLSDGRVIVRVGAKEYAGRPVKTAEPSAA
jgi:hypothetical protein